MKTWDSDVILELTKVPSYIGEEIAEIILDIGTMIRFFRRMGLESFVIPQDSGPREFKISTDVQNRQYTEGSGSMELEHPSESSGKKLNIQEIPIDMISPLANPCRLQIVENLSSHYQKYSSTIVRAYIEKSKYLLTFDFLHSTFLFRNGLFADELVN